MNGLPVVTAEQMREAERAVIRSGISEWDLMQKAGKGAAEWVHRAAAGRAVTVLCGPGNNGGDGYVIARILRERGYDVSVIAPVPPKSETACRACGSYAGPVSQDAEDHAPVVVDCLFGYGLSREVSGSFAALLHDLRASDAYKIAIDLPSFVSCDSGDFLGPPVDYDLTLALGAFKSAHFSMPARAVMGACHLVPLGLDFHTSTAMVSQSPKLSPPEMQAHKYSRGLVAIACGAMPGAALLASEAAMRAGAGYVRLSAKTTPALHSPSLVVEADLSDDPRVSAWLIGPGLGRGRDAVDSLSAVLSMQKPTILDADALHLLDDEHLRKCDASALILTPHDGELAVLCDTFGVEANSKLERARLLHEATGATLLAKGPDTVLAGPHGITVFPAASSWLSVAGTGDVLAGIVAARLAVGGDPMRACEEAVWLHGEAARLAGPAFAAADLSDYLPTAIGAFL